MSQEKDIFGMTHKEQNQWVLESQRRFVAENPELADEKKFFLGKWYYSPKSILEELEKGGELGVVYTDLVLILIREPGEVTKVFLQKINERIDKELV